MERKIDGYIDLLVCPEEYSGKISRLLLLVPILIVPWELFGN